LSRAFSLAQETAGREASTWQIFLPGAARARVAPPGVSEEVENIEFLVAASLGDLPRPPPDCLVLGEDSQMPEAG
jgi:hypothetical protein